MPLKASPEFVNQFLVPIILKGLLKVEIIFQTIAATDLADWEVQVLKEIVDEGSDFVAGADRTKCFWRPIFQMATLLGWTGITPVRPALLELDRLPVYSVKSLERSSYTSRQCEMLQQADAS